MAYPAILGRTLGVPVINLGFSGNGKTEPEIARLLAELDPAAYILDSLPNLETAQVGERCRLSSTSFASGMPRCPSSYSNRFPIRQAFCRQTQRALRRFQRHAPPHLQRAARARRQATLLHPQPQLPRPRRRRDSRWRSSHRSRLSADGRIANAPSALIPGLIPAASRPGPADERFAPSSTANP